jgi:hypothetical protein
VIRGFRNSYRAGVWFEETNGEQNAYEKAHLRFGGLPPTGLKIRNTRGDPVPDVFSI